MTKQTKQSTALCTWAIPRFPRALKNKYCAYCKANDVFVVDFTEYLVAKTLRESGIDIPPIRRDNKLLTLFGQNENL